MEHLSRPLYDRQIGGVCAAFADGYGWDVSAVRVAAVLLAIFTGAGFLAYLICWIVIPEEPVAMLPYAGYYAGGYPPPPPRNYPPSTPPPAA
jgi:phage shock protein PspC (stress-responsive transcriptional regulator)